MKAGGAGEGKEREGKGRQGNTLSAQSVSSSRKPACVGVRGQELPAQPSAALASGGGESVGRVLGSFCSLH